MQCQPLPQVGSPGNGIDDPGKIERAAAFTTDVLRVLPNESAFFSRDTLLQHKYFCLPVVLDVCARSEILDIDSVLRIQSLGFPLQVVAELRNVGHVAAGQGQDDHS